MPDVRLQVVRQVEPMAFLAGLSFRLARVW